MGETIVPLGGGCGSILIGDRVTFGSDDRIYTVSTGAETTCPTSLSGYFITLTEPLATEVPASATVNIQDRGVKDFSVCLKTGWKAVRAMKLWHGRAGWLENCPPACDESLARYRTANRVATYTQIGYGVAQVDYDVARANYATCMASATNEEDAKVCMDDFIAAMVEASTSGPTSYYDYSWERQYTVSTTGAVTQDTCTDNDGGEGWLTSTSAPASLVMFGNWACGPDFSETHSYGPSFNEWFAGGVPDLEWSVQIVQQTNTIIEIEVIGASYESGNFYINTWHGTWVLSEPYALEDCVGDAYSLLGEWDLSDDVQYPWRPPGSWLVTDGGGTHAARIPFVKRREVGPFSPDIGGAACDADLSCSLSTLTPCPYDGEAIGIPLPDGYGPHYAFWDGSGQIAALGWNPGLGLPDTATWWTNSSEELDEDVFPSGGWVFVSSNIVYVQKWCETKDAYDSEGNYIPSVNFFRPCGGDDRTADYKAICGRIAISNLLLDAGTLYVTLSSPATYLETYDDIDFVKYGASPDYTETVDDGDSKTVPDSAGYSVTRTDSTHFTVTGIGSVPDATHIKSHGAPHFKWNDALRKGDFTFCVEETTCGVAETSCEDGCLPLSSCFPAVAAVLPPGALESFPNGEVRELPAAADMLNSYTFRVKPRIVEADPFYTGAVVESRCAPPDGAPAFPSGISYTGCGTLPASRPSFGLGDAVAVLAQPIARAIDAATSKLPKKLRTNVAGCGGCKKRREFLNRMVKFS